MLRKKRMSRTKTIDPSVRNIVLRVSYEGTGFAGWQRQNGANAGKYRTVQEELEKALEKMHRHPVELTGSGRTDSGVHAVGQVANFLTDIDSIPEQRFVPALNSLLPRDIRILDAASAPMEFHARFSAKSRTYRYFMHCGATPLAHELSHVWHIGRWPDLDRLNAMCMHLQGEIDFSTFTAAGDASHSRSRYVYGAHFFFDGNKLIFEITANAFLWKMVRSLTGTLLALEKKGGGEAEFADILHAKNRSRAGPTAPPDGLFLWNVRY